MGKKDTEAGMAYVALNFESLAQARVEKALAIQKNNLISEVIDSVIPSIVDQTVRKFNDRLESEKIAAEQEIENVVKHLPKRSKGPAIVRYLASNSAGVTFSEFQDYLIPGTAYRLTESTDPDSIAAMLRGLSVKLKKKGWKIEINRRGNLIKLVKILSKK